MKAPTLKIGSLRNLRALLVLAGIGAATPFAFGNTEVWIGVHDVSATTNWSDNANWFNVQGTGGPGPNGNDVVFGDQGSGAQGTVNSVVDASLLNPFSLTFTNNSANGNFQTVLIPAGVNLTNANGLTVGIRLSPVTAVPTTVAVVGGGTLVQNGASLQVDDSMTSAATGSGQTATLDLSGLTNLIFINSSSGSTLTVAGTSSGSEARNGGLLNLAAASNYITVSNINVALGSGNGGPGGILNLGTGTNIINTANINLSAGKVNTATLKFFGATGGLRMRGFSGADSDRNVTIVLGNRNTSGTGNPTGVMDFTGGHPVDVKVNSVTEGKSNQSGSGAGGIYIDSGTFDATTINMAVASSTGAVNSTNIVNGGFLIVSNMSLANQTSTGIGTGNLIINNTGTVIVSNNIVKTTTAGVGNITMTGGSLIIGTNIGAPGNAIDNLSVQNSTLTLPGGVTPSAYFTNVTAAGTANMINVSSLPTFFAYPAQFPLISYVTTGGDNNTFVSGNLPNSFVGYISNNVNNLTIDIVITGGPQLAQLKSIHWGGSPTGDWTNNFNVLNWLTNSTPTNYLQGDTVTFDDTLTGTANVNLTMILTPTALTVNNTAVNYAFTGNGKLSGVTGLEKNGTGSLIIDNSGTNDFAGGVSILAGTLQIGNNDTKGNLPAAASWTDNGTLVFSRSDNLTLSTVVAGTGSLVQNGNGKLTVSVAETYSGSTTVSKGTLALNSSGSIANTSGILAQGGAFDVNQADPAVVLNVVNANAGTLVVGTNSVTIPTLGLVNSTLTVAPNFSTSQSISVNSLSIGGTTNLINITAVQNVPDGQPLPIVIPIIRYASPFSGTFNFGETNFPNAYVTNDVANSTIDLVLTASPYLVVWNGGSASGNNFSDSNNWSGIPIFANDALTFDGTTRLTPFNDTTPNTVYSNLTFNGSAGAFTLTGNPLVFNGTLANNSISTQTILLGLGFTNNVTINGAVGPVIIGGGLTNVSGATGTRTLTLMGTGILTNLFGSTSAVGGTNGLILNDSAANWTLLDNASSTTQVAPWAFELNNGTFNFGSGGNAPKLISTSIQGLPSDNQLGNNATATLNFSNGVFTTSARFNTGAGSGSGTVNQYGGTFNIASQFQGANGGASATSAVNLYGGTMNIGVSVASTNTSVFTTNFGPFYVASRGNSSLTITNSALLNCGVLDVSRCILPNISGVVNLDGGTIVASRVSTATANSVAANTGDTATFYFNGGTLRARTNSATFFQGNTVSTATILPITAYVTARGAVVDSDVYSIAFLEPLLTDPNLGGAADGGLTKLGNGTLTLAGANTYIGNTLVSAGTLLVSGQSLSAVTVASGGTLGGNGTISSNVTVNVGGTLSPGTNAVGTLTVGGNVSLAGTTTMEIDKNAGVNDLLEASGATPTKITYGGTLNVVTKTGAIALSDSFKLFDANTYAGSFSAITPATPGAGLAWDTNSLAINGTLNVVVGVTAPTTNATITKVTLSGTNMLVHGTNNNVPNNQGRYVVFATTNLITPLTNWTPVSTNNYNPDGTLDFTNPIVPGTPRQYYDVKSVQ
jgi:autotransporter-associated beta strand protein